MKRKTNRIWPFLLITFLLALIAAPVSAQTQPPSEPNPNLPPQCALDIIFILDESASIESAGATSAVRTAMEAIVADLAGTSSYMAVVEFNIQARRAIIGGSTAYQEIDLGYVSDFSTYINNDSAANTATGYNPDSADSAGTNWEAGLIEAQNIGQRVPGKAPLIIFFTDGVPNRYITAGGGVGNAGGPAALDQTSLNEAILRANALKLAGSHIFVPAYGDVTSSSIQAISGPDVLNPPAVPFPIADYVIGANPAALATAIKSGLASLCAPSVTIKKLVDEGDGYEEADGWQFSATVVVTEQGQAANDYEWTTPAAGLASGAATTTQSGTTDAQGNVQFAWTPNTVLVPEPWTTSVTFTETAQPGYQFIDAVCLKKDDNPNTEDVTINIDSLPHGPVVLLSNEYLACVVRNAAEDFSVTKTANPTQVVAPGGPVVFTVRIDNNTDAQITIDSLIDDQFGDITTVQGDVTATGCSVPQNIPASGFYQCNFTANVTGQAGSTHTNVVTACQEENCDDDDAEVDIVGASIQVTKSANPTEVVAPGGSVVYTVSIENTGDAPVTIDTLVDNVFGDITSVQGNVTATTCDDLPLLLAVDSPAYQCTFTANVTGEPDTTHTNEVEACDTLTYAEFVCDDDDADVDIVEAAIEVTKTANPTQVTAPGGPVVFTVRVENTGDVPVTIDYLDDSIFNDITTIGHDGITATTCDVTPPVLLAVDGFYQCTFTATVNGQAGSTHTNIVTACDKTTYTEDVCDDDDADVEILGAKELEVTKTANPTQVTAPGGPVVFTVRVENTGGLPLELSYLNDSVYGDITTTGHDTITATTCDVTPPVALAVDGFYQCTFTASVTGSAGTTHENTVEACDFIGDEICDEDDAEVDIVGTPEIEVTKTANPTQVTAPGGPVVFTVLIENTGDVPVIIDVMEDDVYNDITTTGHDTITATTCSTPQVINFEGSYQCTFTASVTGNAGTTHTNTVTACDTEGFPEDVCDDDDADVNIIGDGFCPAESRNVGLSMTSMLGMGQGSTAKGFKTRKIVVPNSANVLSLYGQLAATDVGVMKYVRFLYPNNTNVQIGPPTSDAWTAAAISWWGSPLTPSTFIKGQFFWAASAAKSPRAFVLWPTYRTTEEYASVFTTFNDSSKNHVYWQLGWYPQQIQTITLPTTTQAGADIVVRVALVDNNKDVRPVVLTVTAGGVSVIKADNNPTNGDTLNMYTVTLSNVPAGTSSVELKLTSPGANLAGPGWTTGVLGGDSVAMIGAAASYACENDNG